VQGVSLSTILGSLFGFGLFFASIISLTDNVDIFLNLHGAMIVFGGTIAYAYMSFQARYVTSAFLAIRWMLNKPSATREGLHKDINQMVVWARAMSKGGVLELENEINASKIKDPLMKYCTNLVIMDYKAEDLRVMLETAVEAEFERVTEPVRVLKSMASAAPAFGMIGTLVGMVVMMQGLGENLTDIGAGLATALLATLYAVASARLILLPAGEKLQQKEEIQRFRNYLILEGLVMLGEKRSPRYVQDRLNSFLEPSLHIAVEQRQKAQA
jgi:chemotaxis protein MotA